MADDTFLRLFRHAVHALEVIATRDALLFGSNTSFMTFMAGTGSRAGVGDLPVAMESASDSDCEILGLDDKGAVEQTLDVSFELGSIESRPLEGIDIYIY